MKKNLNDVEIFASDVIEAIQIAEELKRNEICNLFRGQTKNWPLIPSILRTGIDKEQEVIRLSKFASWVNSVKELQSLYNSYDKIVAVAQHYGIGTTFLDFTINPEVAGFFATHNVLRQSNEKESGVIVCVNKNLFEESWRDINTNFKNKQGFELTRILELDVNNLWRLQRQEGAFLDSRVSPALLEMYSFFKYIHFPHEGREFDLFNESHIYPREKSHLEIIIDEFFENDSRIKGLERAKEFFGTTIFVGDRDFIGEKTIFLNDKLPDCLDSWNSEFLENWNEEPNEKISNMKKISFSLCLRSELTILEQKEYLYQELFKLIAIQASIRKYSIDWDIKDDNGCILTIDDEDKEIAEDNLIPQIECSDIVCCLWDGLRRLPYSNEQVFDCISSFLIGAKYGYSGIKEIFGDMTGVEFSTNIAINRSTISDELLVTSIRKDFWELVKDEEKDMTKKVDCYQILSILIDPKRLFDFEDFANIFVRNVIPMQPLYLYYDKIIYSPARIQVFGLS